MTHTQHYAAAFLMFLLAALTTSGCAVSSVRQADRLAQEGKWEEAVTAYRQAAKDAPFDAEIQRRLDEAKAQAAGQHHALGKQFLAQNNLMEALREFKIALGFDPSRRVHQMAVGDAMRLKLARDQVQAGKKLQNAGRLEEALTAYEQAAEADPDLAEALTGITEVTAQQRSAKSIGTSSDPITLRFQNAKLKEVFEVVARTAGLNVVFDKEVLDDPVTVFIKDMSFDEALNLILNTNNVTAQRINRNTLLILPNTKQKQAQFQDLMIRTFYLSHAKAKDVANLVRTMIESKRVYVDEKINALVIREEPAKLKLAERALNAVDLPDAEVLLDVEILEVDRNKSLKYGVNFAKVAAAAIVPPGSTGSSGLTTSPITSQFTFQQLMSLGTQSYLFTIPGSILVDFFRNDTDAKTLASPKLRVLNNKPATIQVGDKQPILLSTTNVLPGQAATGAIPTTSTVTSIEFKDTGVKLTVEPVIHLDNQLTLKLKVEVTRLGDRVVLQSSPLISQFTFGTRVAETALMLRDDETVVLGGLIQDDVKKVRQSVPILGDIPLIGQFFSTTEENRVSTEIVLTITPHIIRKLDTPGLEAQAFWSGTEMNYSTTPLFAPHVVPTAYKKSSPLSTEPGHLPTAASSRPNDTLVSQDQGRLAAKAISEPRESGAFPSPQQSGESPDKVARIETQLRIGPGDLSATMGQELRLDIEGAMLNDLVGSIARVTYDSAGLQFQRVASGAAQV
ncbi:MAG: secretin N-terminal domain-containing protein, partial [Nitrospirota bacterium]